MRVEITDGYCRITFVLDRHHDYYLKLDRLIRFKELDQNDHRFNNLSIKVTPQDEDLIEISIDGEFGQLRQNAHQSSGILGLLNLIASQTMSGPLIDNVDRVKRLISSSDAFGEVGTIKSEDTQETDDSLRLQKIALGYLKQLTKALPVLDKVASHQRSVGFSDTGVMLKFETAEKKQDVGLKKRPFLAIRQITSFGTKRYAVSEVNSFGQLGSGVYFTEDEFDAMCEWVRRMVFSFYRRSVSVTKNPIVDYDAMIANAIEVVNETNVISMECVDLDPSSLVSEEVDGVTLLKDGRCGVDHG